MAPLSSAVLAAGKQTPDALRKKAYARLAERVDPARVKHKPLSLVRADARRLADQFFDAEAPTLGRTDRDRMAEDVLASLPGVGPLEELFRDDAVAEVLVLAPALVVAFRAGDWVPTTARFRDPEQVRVVLQRYAEAGEPGHPGAAPVGAVDVRLANGFRVLGLLPPTVMDVCPTFHLLRGPAVTPPPAEATKPAAGRSGVIAPPAPLGSQGGSAVIRRTARPAPTPPPGHTAAEVVSLAAVAPPSAATSGGTSQASGRLPAAASASMAGDPFAKLRQRMTEKIIMRLASAGVYDLNQVPLPELTRFITLAVGEYCQQEGLDPDPAFQQRLGLEILAGMNR